MDVMAFEAAKRGETETLKQLQSTGIDLLSLKDETGATIIHIGARTGSVDLIESILVAANAKKLEPMPNGASPIHDAAACGQIGVVRWLIEQKYASPVEEDASGLQPAHYAARYDRLDVVRYLIDSCAAPIDAKTRGARTAADYAAYGGATNCLQYFKEKDESLCVGGVVVGPAYFATQQGQLSCVRYLVESCGLGSDTVIGDDGMKFVHVAAQSGHLECLSWLIDFDEKSIGARDSNGATPLHYASAQGHVDIVKWLLNHGADVTKDNLGGTPLHDATQNGHVECLKILVSAGANPATKDRDGMTSLQIAKQQEQQACVTYLQSVTAEDEDSESSSSDSDSSEDENRTTSLKTGPSAYQPMPMRQHDSSLMDDIKRGKGLRKAPVEKRMLKQAVGRVIQEETSDGAAGGVDVPQYDNDGQPLPDWKVKLYQKKAEEKTKKTIEGVAKDDAENSRWKGIPEWKRKVLEEKEKKRLEKIAPELARKAAEEERKAKIAAMPEWKRKLLEKKQ